MTVQDVRDRLAEIERVGVYDDEVAHGNEDDLWVAVLESIRDGTAEDVQEMARLALTSSDISFARWYA